MMEMRSTVFWANVIATVKESDIAYFDKKWVSYNQWRIWASAIKCDIMGWSTQNGSISCIGNYYIVV